MTPTRLALSTAILMALAACGGGQSDGTDTVSNEVKAPNSTAAADNAASVQAASDAERSTKELIGNAGAALAVDTRRIASVAQDATRAELLPDLKRIRGDLLLAALLQSQASAASPLTLPFRFANGPMIGDDHKVSMAHHQDIQLGSQAENLGKYAVKLHHQHSGSGKHEAVTVQYGVTPINNRIDLRNGDVASLGPTLLYKRGESAETKTMTAPNALTINMLKLYDSIMSWESTDGNGSAGLYVERNSENPQELGLCLGASERRPFYEDHPTVHERATCNYWDIPENWRFGTPLKLKRVSVKDTYGVPLYVWVSQTDNFIFAEYEWLDTYWIADLSRTE